ncbi:Pre-rRNA-processing protein TSR2, putative [Ricinus communis]|uniref:Pre-rRNA-processing protein TSR2, putative n=1 Tax=Ricinus communis TaxID=3988 RepID=B9REU3_RICCO|nr:Pre-rRNA-processing protein TSR2, putative [Ricinus communis]|eukprot:XP_002512262.1 pre-rRNA-processing protein TSR2 homolog [Ricinus communis]
MNAGSSTPNNQNGSLTKQLPPESVPLFQEGIFLILSRWSALQLAVENEWGGRGSRQLADQIGFDIFSWFTQSKEPLYIDDLENILDEGMISLNTMIEDGSVEEVAEKLMIMHEECLEGNYHTIEQLRQARPTAGVHQHIRQAANGDDDEDDDSSDDDDNSMGDNRSNMMMDAPKFQSKPNEVDMQVNEPSCQEAQVEDEWTVISSKKNRGKRN